MAPSIRRAAALGDAVAQAADPRRPVVLMLLPKALEGFILRDQAEDLLKAKGVYAVDPPRVPYGALGRMPSAMADRVGAGQAKRLVRSIRRRDERIAAVIIFHPFQYPLARGILGFEPECELWYGRWDRYEKAYDADDKLRARLAELHEQAAARATITFAASVELARLEQEAGRDATLVPLAADSFPAPDPRGGVVAVSLGHLGWRTDWPLMRAICEAMPELTMLLIGAWHDDELKGDEDYAACRASPNVVWLGSLSDEEAARMILCADVGIVPFKLEPFNDAGLPYRILKYARLGRRTISSPLAGVATWAGAVTTAEGADAWIAALRASAGARSAPDMELRAWALDQTARKQDAPLWTRLRELGVDTRGA